jgi:hypothetical protein
MLLRRVFLSVLLVFFAFPLSATLMLEEFTAASMPAGWSQSADTGYAIAFPGGNVVFSRAAGIGTGFARLTYGSTVSGDFLAAAVVEPGFTLVNGGIMALVGNVGGEFFDAYLRDSFGSTQAAAYNSYNSDNPWTPWSYPEGTLIIFRAGNTIQAGVMGAIPMPGGIPDLSGFTPLGVWTGDQYLGTLSLQLSFGHDAGDSGAEQASVDLFALGTPPYTEFIPPGGAAAIPEPATAGLLGAGLAVLLLKRRRRSS